MQKIRQWLIDTYNGLYVIVLKPYMPSRQQVITLIFALLFGIIFAYALNPVQFYNAAPHRLAESYRDEWIKLVAAANEAGFYDEATIQQLLSLVDNPSQNAEEMIADLQNSEQGNLTVVRALQNIQGIAAQTSGTDAVQPPSFITDILGIVIFIVLAVVLLAVFSLLWGLLFKPNVIMPIRELLRPKTEEDAARKEYLKRIRETREAEEKMRQQSATAATTNPYGAPITQRLAVYTKGRNFDESFAIENEADEFLGECGATIAKTIGDSNEPCAVEVWLFDKDDFVRTFTKLFVTEYAYNDPVIRAELETRVDDKDNDFIIASPNGIIQLETDAILMQADIMEMTLGSEGGLPPNSYFKALTLQIQAWQKSSGGGAKPVTQAELVMTAPATYAPPPAPTQQSSPIVNAPPPARDATAFPPPPSSQPPPPPQRKPNDDDPFGGTGDFTPIGRS